MASLQPFPPHPLLPHHLITYPVLVAVGVKSGSRTGRMAVAVGLGPGVLVADGVALAVKVALGVNVSDGVKVTVGVSVGCGVLLAVGLGPDVALGVCAAISVPTSGAVVGMGVSLTASVGSEKLCPLLICTPDVPKTRSTRCPRAPNVFCRCPL
jgi:hypothetical protein